MPSLGGLRNRSDQDRPATLTDVAEHIRINCGLPSAGPTVGAEVEWLVVDRADPNARPTVARLEAALSGLTMPGGSRVSFEPGGQVELSSVPTRTPDEAHANLLADIAVLRPALRACGLDLEAAAHDPSRRPLRVSDSPRYEAMERWFAAGGWSSAPEMMCNTASIQVNLGCGADPAWMWRRANELAPLLAAMFASSPKDGWASTRLRAWAHLDPSRTSTALSTGQPLEDWTRYALSARAIMRAGSNGHVEPLDGGFTLREWIEQSPVAWPAPTMADVALHLSTLFPPVRLKAWIEIRVIDMVPDDWWPVPLAVTTALLVPPDGQSEEDDLSWLGEARELTWEVAGREGLRSPEVAATANHALGLAQSRLERAGSRLAATVGRFREQVVAPNVERPGAVSR